MKRVGLATLDLFVSERRDMGLIKDPLGRNVP